jgi:four helix bundle protein
MNGLDIIHHSSFNTHHSSSPMNRQLTDRAKAFSVRIVRMYAALPQSRLAQVPSHQALRCGTSVGAHCREAFRSRSTAEAISKLEVALQELDETAYWLELMIEAEIVPAGRLAPLLREIDELTAIFVTSVKTMKARKNR